MVNIKHPLVISTEGMWRWEVHSRDLTRYYNQKMIQAAKAEKDLVAHIL